MVCGYLDTKGTLYPCSRWEHTSKAKELVDKFSLRRTKPFKFCEDVLLENGWICIRTSDVYKSAYDCEKKILFITDEQQKFFEDHKTEFNERQLVDIEDMLRDFGKLYQFHKKGN